MSADSKQVAVRVRSRQDTLWTALVVLVFGLVIIRVSWICDDAFITFRSIENFVHGYGPVYNVGERVQTFTHPLWMLVLSASYFFLNQVLVLEIPALLAFITLAWSWFFTAISVAIMLKMSRGRPIVFSLAALLLISSRAFTDFAASGLENPLTCMLITAFVYLQTKPIDKAGDLIPAPGLASGLIAGLITLNRMDALLIVLPVIVSSWYASKQRTRYTSSLLLGFLPFLAWELFSLIYYGFPFPNTAYAKLNSGIAAGAYFQQGFFYLLNSISLDPLTLCVVFLGIVWGVSSNKKPWPAISLGMGLYLAYILRIGGDYMSGRFLNPLVFVSVLILMGIEFDWEELGVPIAAGILVISLVLGTAPFLSDSTYANQLIDIRAIADERGFRYADWGFLRISKNSLLPSSSYSGKDWQFGKVREVRVSGAIGLDGYMRGPETHILDIMALADPLLARLPAIDQEHWRIGHIEREIPEGYQETLRTGENQIKDESIHAYYAELSKIVSGPIWDAERWQAIIHSILQPQGFPASQPGSD